MSDEKERKNPLLFQVVFDEHYDEFILRVEDYVTDTQMSISESIMRERGANDLADNIRELIKAVKGPHRKIALFGEGTKFLG